MIILLEIDLNRDFHSKKALIIVESPLQLLCAYECITYFNLNYTLYIRLTNNELNNQQLKNITKELNLQNSNFFLLDAKRNFLNLVKIIKLLVIYKKNNYDMYVLGDYLSTFLKVFSKTIDSKKIVLLDDGVATFKIQMILKKYNLPLSLFTIFDIEAIEHQQIFTNHFSAIQNKYKSEENKKVDIFIGGKLVDLKIVTLDVYLAILNKIVENSETGKLFYFPHRGTSQFVLDEIISIDGIELIYPDVSVEFYLLREKIYPKNIYSVLSTALFSLSIIFKHAKVIAYKPIFLKNTREDNIEKLYEDMNQHKIIKVEELI